MLLPDYNPNICSDTYKVSLGYMRPYFKIKTKIITQAKTKRKERRERREKGGGKISHCSRDADILDIELPFLLLGDNIILKRAG